MFVIIREDHFFLIRNLFLQKKNLILDEEKDFI